MTNQSSIKTVDLKRFSDAVGFIPQFRMGWGNTRKANISQVSLSVTATDDANQDAAKEAKAKTRMLLKKTLIVSKEYDAIKSYMGEIRSWVYQNTVPSFFKEGFQLVKLEGVEAIERYMRRAIASSDTVAADVITLPKLVDAFIAAYPAQVEESRRTLEPVGQFNANDYPAPEALRGMFDILWNWVSFSTPAGLPPELRAAEEAKMNKQMSDAAEEVTKALRLAMSEMIRHAQERLTSAPGEKAKIFRDSAIGNIMEFLDTFNQRNITNDVKLAQLVGKAREVLAGVTPQKIRQVDDVKKKVVEGFAQINADLEKLLVEVPGRKFDLDDEPEPAKEATAPAAENAQEPAQLALA